MTKGNLHSAGLACLILVTVLSCLVSFSLLLEKFDAKIASKDAIIASMNEELLSKNIMVDSMTQEIEKLVDELASTNNNLLASNEAIINSSTQQMMEKRHVNLLASNKEAIIESDQLHSENDASTTIPTWLVLSCKDVIQRCGNINFPDFLAMMARNVKGREDILKAYKVFDRDGSGSISTTELRRILTNFGEKLTEAEFNEIWSD